MSGIGVGAEAPDFTKTTQNGESITLSQYRGDKTVVLYFYPKDETPGCTAEACTFRDNFEDFVDAGAVVIGVSQDSDSSHKRFAEHHGVDLLGLDRNSTDNGHIDARILHGRHQGLTRAIIAIGEVSTLPEA